MNKFVGPGYRLVKESPGRPPEIRILRKATWFRYPVFINYFEVVVFIVFMMWRDNSIGMWALRKPVRLRDWSNQQMRTLDPEEAI